MRFSEFARAFSRSPAGIGSLFLGALAGAAALFLGAGAALAALAGVALFAAVVALSLATGVGQRAAAAELERGNEGKAAERVAAAKACRSRLAAIRIARPEVAAARDLAALEAGSFVEACSRAKSYDPEGVAAIEAALALVDAWLKEADAAAVERRFDLPDADPFPAAAERTAAAIREKAAAIAAARERVSGEAPASVRVAIEEELK
jgi:hypothetical protein